MLNSMDPDKDQHFVGLDLDPNCFQRLSADDKLAARKERSPIMTVSDSKFNDIFFFIFIVENKA